MEGWGQIPSQPSNFVSLLHLRERWLKQNDPNQHQKLQLQPTGNKNGQKPEDVKPLLHNPPIHTTSWSCNYPAVPVSSRPCNVNQPPPPALPLIVSDDKKKPRSQSEDVAEALLTVSSIESQGKKKKHLMKKKPKPQSEDVGEALLAVSPTQSDEKKKKKHLMKKKPRSLSEDVVEAPLPVSPVESDENKKNPISLNQDVGGPLLAVYSIRRDEKKKKPRSQSEHVDEREALLDKKKKSKRKPRPKKPVSQTTGMDRTSPKPEENLKEEMQETECEAGTQNEKKDVRTSPTPEVKLKKEMRRKGREVREQSENKHVRARKIDEKKGIESQCGSGTANTDVVELENKLSCISVSFESKRGRSNGVYKGSSHRNRNFRDPRDLHRLAPRKTKDAGMIWMRKDELPKGA